MQYLLFILSQIVSVFGNLAWAILQWPRTLSYCLLHVVLCWQAQRVEEVRKQSEAVCEQAADKLREKISVKLDGAEENRQNQLKSIKIKLQEHVSSDVPCECVL